jgi:hypothetical protein
MQSQESGQDGFKKMQKDNASRLCLKSLANGSSCKIMQMSRILQIMTFQPACSTEPSSQPLLPSAMSCFLVENPETPFFFLFHFSPLGQDILSTYL